MTDRPPDKIPAATPLQYDGTGARVSPGVASTVPGGMVVRRRSWIGRVFGETVCFIIAGVIVAGMAALLVAGARLHVMGAIGAFVALLAVAGISAAVSTFIERTWRARAERAIELIAQAVNAGAPLPEFLSAASESESRGLRRSLLAMSGMLHNGVALPSAFHATFPRSPGWMGDALDVPPGRSLAASVAHLQARQARERATQLLALRGYNGRFLLVLAVILGVSALLFVFVMPSYAKILRDFNVKSPWFEQMTSRTFYNFISSEFTLLLPSLLILVWIVSMVARLSRSRPNVNDLGDTALFRAVREWWDRATWYVPVIGAHARDRAWSTYFDRMAGQVSDAVQLATAANVAAVEQANAVSRDRGFTFARELTLGAPLSDAARRARLPRLATDLLTNATTAGQIESVCQLVSDRFGERAVRRAEVVRAVVPIALTLLLAVPVFYVVLTVFLPMVDLINATAPKQMGGMP